MLPSDPQGNFRQQRPQAIKTELESEPTQPSERAAAGPAAGPRALSSRVRPARRSSGPRGEPRAAHDLAKSAPRLRAPGALTRRSKSFPPRRDAGDGNNQRTRAPGPGPDRGDGDKQGRAPGAAPFPTPRTGGLGPGGDTKKPGRPTPPAGARSDPGAPRPLTSLRRPPRTPLSRPGRSFPWPGSDPRHPAGSRPSPPPPPARGTFLPSPPPLPLPPAVPPSPPQPAPSRAPRDAGAPRPRSPAAAPRGRGLGPAPVGAPPAWLPRSPLLLGLLHAFSVQPEAGAPRSALRS